MKTTLIHAALFAAVLLTPLAAPGADETLTPAEAKEIAKEAFLWGMHPVAIYHLRFSFAQNELNPRAAGINRLSWFREPMKALPRVATTPNATTLYGVGMFDLSEEPAVIIVPEIEDHYWSVQLHDNYSRWWHMIGSQFNAPGPVRRLLIGPNWSGDLPDGFVGADIVQSQSDFAGVLARVALPDVTEEEVRNRQRHPGPHHGHVAQPVDCCRTQGGAGGGCAADQGRLSHLSRHGESSGSRASSPAWTFCAGSAWC